MLSGRPVEFHSRGAATTKARPTKAVERQCTDLWGFAYGLNSKLGCFRLLIGLTHHHRSIENNWHNSHFYWPCYFYLDNTPTTHPYLLPNSSNVWQLKLLTYAISTTSISIFSWPCNQDHIGFAGLKTGNDWVLWAVSDLFVSVCVRSVLWINCSPTV
jgi:hypothetical protein